MYNHTDHATQTTITCSRSTSNPDRDGFLMILALTAISSWGASLWWSSSTFMERAEEDEDFDVSYYDLSKSQKCMNVYNSNAAFTWKCRCFPLTEPQWAPLREAWDFVMASCIMSLMPSRKQKYPLWTNYVEINPLLEYYSHQINEEASIWEDLFTSSHIDDRDYQSFIRI